jgi:hypothetical protein
MPTPRPPTPRTVVVAYRPKPGKDADLLAEVRNHQPELFSLGLATARPAIFMRAKDGAVLEVFEWASADAIKQAHSNPKVHAIWGRFAACCDIIPLSQVAETADLFAEFDAL